MAYPSTVDRLSANLIVETLVATCGTRPLLSRPGPGYILRECLEVFKDFDHEIDDNDNRNNSCQPLLAMTH